MKLRRSWRSSLLALSMAALLPMTASTSAGDSPGVRIERGPGIMAVAFPLPYGTIYFNLPDDLSAGDRLSGTVVAVADGRSAPERKANGERLADFSVQVGRARTTPKQGILYLELPRSAAEAQVSLLDVKGRALVSARIPVAAAPQARVAASGGSKPGFRLPSRGLAGNRVRVVGAFGGDLSATSVRVGSEPAHIVAESPRQCIFDSPTSPIGTTTIETKEGRSVCRGTYRNIRLHMSIGRSTLLRGEQTVATIELEGLGGLREPLTLTLTNETPAIVSMASGEKQELDIAPAEVASEGAYTTTRTLTGIQRGDFNINGYLPWREEDVQCPTDEGIIPVDEPKKEAHHCQGGRLVMIIGDFKNKTIAASLRWAQGLKGDNLYRMAYDTGSSGKEPEMRYPHVPPGTTRGDGSEVPAGAGWPRFETKAGENGDLKGLLATWKKACYFDEVLIMFHGHQTGGWHSLVGYLPPILDNRPVRKLVLWSCESTNQFLPGSGGDTAAENYRQICGIVRPKSCPCDCKPGICQARNADGVAKNGRSPLECPTASDSVTILTSGSLTRDKKRYSAKLGLHPKSVKTPFVSPDGSLRRITVAPDGTITAEIADSSEVGSVFDGKGIGKQDPDDDLAEKSTVPVGSLTDSSGKIKAEDPISFLPAGERARPAKDFQPKADPTGKGCFLGPADTSQ